MRVLCTLPHCSSPINGVPFDPTPGGWVSAALSPEQAAAFLAIPGYAPYYGPAPGVAEEPVPAALSAAANPDLPADPEPVADLPSQPAPARRTRPRTPR